MVRARLLDQARRRNGGGDVGCAAEHVCAADDGGDVARALDAILQRQDDGAGRGERREHRERRAVVVGLDGEEHQVLRAHVRRRVGCAGVDRELATRRADGQPTLTNGRQVRAAREERDLVSGARQQGAVIAADGSGSDDSDPHGLFHCGILDRAIRHSGRDATPAPVPVRRQARGHQQQARDRLDGALQQRVGDQAE